MKHILVLLAALSYTAIAYSQNTFRALIKDAETNELLTGATAVVSGTTKGASSDTGGTVVLTGIPAGRQIILYSYLGYKTRQDTLIFPLSTSGPVEVLLQREGGGEELSEVTVSATRSSRTIDNIPTRVEVISGEELDEKSNMKPGDIRMLLSESTGVQTQQTSATSGNSSIRIQGLDGKYTQIIRDGFPLYSGFSGGLGLLQVAPLDLKQVEVIKGSSSTLYGGGTIAGLVNLVSRTPDDGRRFNVLLNGTSAKGLDASAFLSEKFKKSGVTLYAAYNHGDPYDPSDIDLTAIPRYNRYTLNPRLFLYPGQRSTLSFGVNSTFEKRIGGDLHYIRGERSPQHSYFEENKSSRHSSQLQFDHRFTEHTKLTFKNSFGYFDRTINLPDYHFSGVQRSSYSELNYAASGERSDWVAGVNFLTDAFKEVRRLNFPLRDYSNNTAGAFVQNTFNFNQSVTIESGLRGDYNNDYGFFFLPRLSMLWKINRHLSGRLGGGLGYKAPTVFTEDAERIQFRNVLPLDGGNTRAERSYGLNFDVNYRTGFLDNRVGFSINQLIFYSRISRPIMLTSLPDGNLQYTQPGGHLDSKGLETNVKVSYSEYKLFVGYTLADVNRHSGSAVSSYPLVSRHRLNNVLTYEIEDKWKIGAEAYYFGSQKLNDGARGKAYWTAGFMVEKIWEGFSVFINFENITDTRQTKFDTIYEGSITDPAFRDIYAPLDGFVVNGGIKLQLSK